MRDVFAILSNLQRLKPHLNKMSLVGDKIKNLRDDIYWRAEHLGTTVSYWNLVKSDMPWQLSEGISLDDHVGPDMGDKPTGRNIDKQALSKHPFFGTPI